MKKLFILLLLFCIPHYTNAFFYRYKYKDKTVCKLFGYTWGWHGNERLTKEQVELLIEKIESQANDRTVKKNKITDSVHDLLVKNNGKSKTQMSENRIGHIVLPDLETFFQQEIPTHMVLCHSTHYLWGYYKVANNFHYPVVWQDDERTDRSILITNQTGELIFIDDSFQPENLKNRKKIQGILNGHVRLVTVPRHNKIIVWRRLKEYTDLKDVYTIFTISKEKKSLYLTKKGTMIVNVDAPVMSIS